MNPKPSFEVSITRIETGLQEVAECVPFEPIIYFKMRLAVRRAGGRERLHFLYPNWVRFRGASALLHPNYC